MTVCALLAFANKEFPARGDACSARRHNVTKSDMVQVDKSASVQMVPSKAAMSGARRRGSAGTSRGTGVKGDVNASEGGSELQSSRLRLVHGN